MEKISDDVTKGASKSAARAMLRAVGLEDDDFNKFQVGVVSAGNEVTPCNLTGPELSEFAKKGVNGPDSAALIFSTIAVSDGISMGHEGMRASSSTIWKIASTGCGITIHTTMSLRLGSISKPYLETVSRNSA